MASIEQLAPYLGKIGALHGTSNPLPSIVLQRSGRGRIQIEHCESVVERLADIGLTEPVVADDRDSHSISVRAEPTPTG